ncbi:SPOR domain-containing protein [Methylotenera sp. G11]|uniref:SPOR domain-containing protein n=1 Tax=Methylotenera sp. G11 TaxID=1506585 RepID=UPI0006471CFB|nr:SPOR domain-containing protein [Methylotenera sp. G11]
MPPDLPNEQELMLKKRARRRLVGAVALVLLMVIILPQVLQDRALLAQQEPIRITMPEIANASPEPTVNHAVAEPAGQQDVAAPELAKPEPAKPVGPVLDVKALVEAKKPEITPPEETLAPKPEKKVEVKAVEAGKLPEAGKTETKTPVKSAESFTVQVGVYSDVANVKRLQEQLKQAGFSTHTEKVTTPKGDSLRLKAGNFKSREDAVAALGKIKAAGLSGIVIGND